ncbi:MAG: translation elongation factor 4, partial [Chitinophagales bacterium]|nr:translation elongation factor 4 [Chitinophagales bacterium]
MENIRNFCIIAHIDHGKSTLADRLIETTKTISERQMMDTVLDNMDLERERGITIKSHAIQMDYFQDGQKYAFNLIDTPGHVDFSYEVSRSLAACEGVLLLVDASQGIQAQTISNLYLAVELGMTIIPVINKIDMPGADPELVEDQMMNLTGCKREEIIRASGRTGQGVDEILSAIVARIPAPKGKQDAPFRALIFDSMFNSFRGVIAYYRVVDGSIKKGDQVKFFHTANVYNADEVGVLRMDMEPRPEVKTGDVGYIITGIKNSKEIKVGDTITSATNPCEEAIHGFEDVKPMVFAGIYPLDNDDYADLRDSLEKLQLNDASLVFEPETSIALGFGFRCGFLGLLHLEIVTERLEREYDMSIITTVPQVSYNAYLTDGTQLVINNPADMPEIQRIESLEEPYIRAQVITKPEYFGSIISLCMDKRGILTSQNYLTEDRVEMMFEMPMAEIVFDFYDKLKSISRGYASFDYHRIDFRKGDLVKLDILLNAERVDAFSAMIHRTKAEDFGRRMCEKLKELIPPQQFSIPIQAAIGAKVIARETISALRKDVTAKCYGGDISRKRKLLEKQKKGKKRMRQFGKVEVPQEAFISVL